MVSSTDKNTKSGYVQLISGKILRSHTSDSVILAMKYLFFCIFQNNYVSLH